MTDTMEIIISAVDSASEVFQSIISTVTDFGSNVSDVVNTAGAEFDGVAENVTEFQDAVANIDSTTVEALADTLGMSTEEVERLIETGAQLGSIPFDDATAGALELEDAVRDTGDAMDDLGSAGDVMAAQTFMDVANGIKDSMLEFTDAAGQYGDSMTRVGLAAEGAGISADDMKSAVSSLSDETGRAGSSIRESMISMTSAGITDMDAMQTVFKGASAQAFILGTDVDSLADKFSGMAMKSTLSERTLKGTGVTMQELGEAMGLHGATVDEVKDKWKELDTNQRAAALGMAASMNEGKTANDEYKNSWAGLQEQVDIAKGKLERIIGSIILPVVIPAMHAADHILSGLGDTLEYLMKSPLGGVISIVGTMGGVFLGAVAGVAALKSILGFLKLEAMFTAVQTTALTIAEEMQGGASFASAAANAVGASGFAGLATAAWGAATAVWAVLAPFLPFIAIGAAVVLVIYEVGKAFGWWTDASSMIDAIFAGLNRLWSAFINHPDVQAVLGAISEAWNALIGAIGGAWNAIMEFFGVSTSSDFDVVRSIIDSIGAAWNFLRQPIMAVINIIRTVLTVLWDLVNGNTNAISAIQGIWNTLVANMPVILNALFAVFRSIWNNISSFVVNMVKSIVTRVVSNFRSLIGKVGSALRGVVNAIRSAIQAWINAAVQKVRDLISKITSPFSGVAGKISSALGGVADALLSPFKTAWEWIKPYYDKIKGALEAIGNIPGIAAGGELETSTDNTSISPSEYTVNVDDTPIQVEYTINLNWDLLNVPTHINTRDLINALKDKTVIASLTGNKDFQDADLKVKSRIRSRTSRQRGA